MSDQKVVLLDGARSGDKGLDAILLLLLEVLHRDKNNTVSVEKFTLREMKIHHCIGCFNCWLKTPGQCIYPADAGSKIFQSVVNSDLLIFFTPIVFGGYSSDLKRMADRFLPIALPFFEIRHNETHHPSRYKKLPRLLGIGVASGVQKEFSSCFKNLVKRNAVNAEMAYTAKVLNKLDSPEKIRTQLYNVLFRKNNDGNGNIKKVARTSNLQATFQPAQQISTGNRKILLIIGSPKTLRPSTSALLGYSLLEQLREKYGWETDSFLLQSDLQSNEGRKKLCSAVESAGTLVLSFPLYIDSLPFLATKALEIIASYSKTARSRVPKNFVAIVNSGFPEADQNLIALSICRHFAFESGMVWAGHLAMGAGEGLLSGQSPRGFKGLRGMNRPPLYYVNRALYIAAAALAAGRPIPEKAMQLIAKNPIPFVSFAVWRLIHAEIGKKIWENEAVKNGISKQAMFDMPYLKD